VLPTSIFPTVDCLVERRAYFANFGLLLIVAGLLVGKNNKELKVWKKYSAIALLVVYFGISFHRNEVFASERKIWEESLSSYPGYSRAMINTAWCLVMDQEYERGEEILKSVNHYMPLNTEVLAKLGTLYTMIGFKNRDSYIALNYFQRAVEINSDYYIGRFLTAELLMNLGRYPEAKDMLQKAIHTNPNYGAAYLLLGKIAEAEKDFGLAQQLAAKAHEIDPAGNLY
jgi:tetratricopeptide (TPR) repeat protein